MDRDSLPKRPKIRNLIKQHRQEFYIIAFLFSLSLLLGWIWHGIWLLAALCLLHLIGLWDRYTADHLVSHTDEKCVEAYRKLWGDNWQKALGRDHPDLLSVIQRKKLS